MQPINHKYDHSYVIDAMTKYPHLFKGMLLHDPSLDVEYALRRLDELILKGFVGVRFNPYLWNTGADDNDNKYMSKGTGLEVYKRCGELNVPVGIMCFKGIDLHYDDIVDLLEKSPETTLILDHFGFTTLSSSAEQPSTEQFKMLLSLAKYQNVIVKISALFRVAGGKDKDPYPFDRVKKERFDVLLEKFGKDRLMFGTDFPYVLNEEGQYKGAVDVVKSWTDDDKDVQDAIMHGNAERLFGEWGVAVGK